MNKIVLIVVGALIVLCAIFFVFRKSTKVSNHKQLELTYEINSGIPFKWEYEIGDSSIVKFVKSYVVDNENKEVIDGASVSTNYVFEGLKEGTTTITFKYVNFADNYVSSEEKHIVKVDSDNNIFLVKEEK